MTAVEGTNPPSAGAGGPDAKLLSARQVAWARRRDSARRSWQDFRGHRSGVVGLGILVFFVLVAILAPLLASSAGLSETKATGGVLQSPTSHYLLGTDESGRSILTLLIWGSRISLFVGLAATVISTVLGTVIGIASGHYGGWVGAILFRLTEWVLVVPFLPLAIVLASILGASLLNIAIVIGVTSWPSPLC